MNILQILPRLEEGGVETGTVDLAKYLVQHKHKAVVISGGGRLVSKLVSVGGKHYELPVYKKSLVSIFKVIPKIVEIIRSENIDIIHARSRIPAISAFFAARITKRIFITTAHGHYSKNIFSKIMGMGKFVIVPSNAMAEHMATNFKVPIEKIKFVPRGVDLNNFHFKQPDISKKGTFTIGLIARLSKNKGHKYFIKAVSLVYRQKPNINIVIAGKKESDSDEYEKELKTLTRRLGLDNIIHFLGSTSDVPSLMHQLDLLVLPTVTNEAFGRVIIEAMASGIPVIATKVGGIVDIIENEKNGFLCIPEDPKDLADKILLIINNPEKTKELVYKAEKTVKEKYALDDMGKKTVEVYKQALYQKRILIFKLGALGDLILSVPSLREIRRTFKDSHIKLITSAKNAEVVVGCPYIDELLIYENMSRRNTFFSMLNAAKKLSAFNFDLSIDLQNNKKTHMVAFFAGIPLRYGYDNGKFSFLLNRRIKDTKMPTPPITHQSRVLKLAGVDIKDKSLELWLTDSSKEWAANFIKNEWVRRGQPLIGISPFASNMWPTKSWPVKNIAEFCDLVAKRLNARVVITGKESDSVYIEEISKITNTKPINASGKTSIMKLAALIKRCDCFVSTDSAPLHIAAAVSVPFVALFGPTMSERHIEVENILHIILQKKIRCRPCYKRKCFRRKTCMGNISAMEVFEAVDSLIKAKREKLQYENSALNKSS